MKLIIKILFFSSVFTAPFIVEAGSVLNTSYFDDLVSKFGSFLGLIPAFLFAVGVVILFFGLFKMVSASGNEEARKTGRKTAIIAIIGLVIMVSIYAIIAIFQKVFGIGGGSAPPYPAIPPVWYGTGYLVFKKWTDDMLNKH